MAAKRALILGVTGQDGAHLAKRLLDQGWEVYGGFRRGSTTKTWRLDHLGITSAVHLVECQINALQNVMEAIREARPDHIYHLAGESFVADSFKYPNVTLEANAGGTLNVLEGLRLMAPEARLFCASSSEVFGRDPGSHILDESSPCAPSNPYGISKLAAQHLVRLYREAYGLRSCAGILFNHEGPLRARAYVTRKITFNMARLRVKGGEAVELGALDAARDWGAAEDYAAAMQAMLEVEVQDDFVIATGRVTTVRDFLMLAARAAGFEPAFEGRGIDEVCIDARTGTVLARVAERYFRPHDTPPLAGDARRLMAHTHWKGSRDIAQLVDEMVAADIRRWETGITHV